jgi:hypothetical protein
MPGFAIGDQSGTGQTPEATVEMRRLHRWRFTAVNGLIDRILIYAFKADRPKPTIDPITIHRQQEEIYFPGKIKWDPVNISFYESENQPDTAIQLAKWIKAVLDWKNGLGQDRRSDAELEMLSGQDSPTYKITMKRAWPSSITPDELDYSSSEISKITVQMRYDKADLPTA